MLGKAQQQEEEGVLSKKLLSSIASGTRVLLLMASSGDGSVGQPTIYCCVGGGGVDIVSTTAEVEVKTKVMGNYISKMHFSSSPGKRISIVNFKELKSNLMNSYVFNWLNQCNIDLFAILMVLAAILVIYIDLEFRQPNTNL